MKTLYLAGGCFWGLEAFLRRLPGVTDTLCGYANGKGDAPPDYEEVCRGDRGFAETVRVDYNEATLSTEALLGHFFRVIDPTAYHRQGNDCGVQYRSGIYWADDAEGDLIKSYVNSIGCRYTVPVCTETLPLMSFFPAEEYHRNYLQKNPGGYCHIDLCAALEPVRFRSPVRGDLPRENAPGLYVDAASGTPVFSWRDREGEDESHLIFSAPVRSHSITPEIAEPLPRLRCTNSGAEMGFYGADCNYYVNKSSIVFIPREQMEERGYGDYRI